ncbi:MAG: Ig-like domain-containing protein, partial [Gemmatimonadota bacterium]|nr:Ig-like domain-containing protein [Gemmatimonadota bacterium]
MARSALLLAVPLLLAGCRDSTKPIPVASVTIEPGTATLTVGSSLQLLAFVHDADNNVLSDRAITWKSLNPAAATVSAIGVVNAIASGAAVITATSEGVTATATITSRAAVASVLVSAPNTTLVVG